MTPVTLLKKNGICALPPPYSTAELAKLNAAVDEYLCERSAERRAYLHIDEMLELGVLDIVLGPGMRDVMLAIMPDPVLYHALIIETAGNDPESNIFGDQLAGWHRDVDSLLFRRQPPTHVSIFTYLTDVGPDDGPFAFVPQDPRWWLRSTTPVVAVAGGVGHTFAWQRSFYHRAAPNRGPRRRRVIKLSIQRNAFRSSHLQGARFQRAIAAVPPGDAMLDTLFGRYQGRIAPKLPRPEMSARPIAPSTRLALDDGQLTASQIRAKSTALAWRVRGLFAHRAEAQD